MAEPALTAHELIAYYKKQHGDGFGLLVAQMMVDSTARIIALERRVRELETSKKR